MYVCTPRSLAIGRSLALSLSSCLTRLQELRHEEAGMRLAVCSKAREAEFIMQLEVELYLQKNDSSIEQVTRSHTHT